MICQIAVWCPGICLSGRCTFLHIPTYQDVMAWETPQKTHTKSGVPKTRTRHLSTAKRRTLSTGHSTRSTSFAVPVDIYCFPSQVNKFCAIVYNDPTPDACSSTPKTYTIKHVNQNDIQLAHCSLSCEGCAKLNKEVLEAAKKCDKINLRPQRIRLSQLKLQWGSCS
jgi:hypothetical protein